MSRLPVVAVLGRPNVGKSTLVNRILQRENKRTPRIVLDVSGYKRRREDFLKSKALSLADQVAAVAHEIDEAAEPNGQVAARQRASDRAVEAGTGKRCADARGQERVWIDDAHIFEKYVVGEMRVGHARHHALPGRHVEPRRLAELYRAAQLRRAGARI